MEHRTAKLGCSVHFVHKHEGDVCEMHAAIISKVHPLCDGEEVACVDLHVMECEGVVVHKNVKHCAEKSCGTYHFPCEM